MFYSKTARSCSTERNGVIGDDVRSSTHNRKHGSLLWKAYYTRLLSWWSGPAMSEQWQHVSWWEKHGFANDSLFETGVTWCIVTLGSPWYAYSDSVESRPWARVNAMGPERTNGTWKHECMCLSYFQQPRIVLYLRSKCLEDMPLVVTYYSWCYSQVVNGVTNVHVDAVVMWKYTTCYNRSRCNMCWSAPITAENGSSKVGYCTTKGWHQT